MPLTLPPTGKRWLAGRLAAVACLLVPMPHAAGQALVLERRIELPSVQGRIDHMAADVAGQRLFVAALGADSLEIVDLGAGRRVSRIANLHEPQGVAYGPTSGRVFVANAAGGGVLALAGTPAAAQGRAADLEDADNLRLDPKSGRLYAGYGSALAVLEPETMRVMQRIPLAGHPESFQLEDAGPLLYVNVPRAGHIAVVDRVAGQVVATWPIAAAAANYAMALDEPGRRLFVATRRPALLLAFDLRSGRETARQPTCGDADDLFADLARHRLYLVCGEGMVRVVRLLEGGGLQVAESVATAPGARTGLFVPGLDRLFVAVPSRGAAAAEIREYSTR